MKGIQGSYFNTHICKLIFQDAPLALMDAASQILIKSAVQKDKSVLIDVIGVKNLKWGPDSHVIVLRRPLPFDYIPVPFKFNKMGNKVTFFTDTETFKMKYSRLVLITEGFIRLALIVSWEHLNLQMFHGASFVVNNRGIAFLGPGGSGKSTLVRLAMERRMRLIGDDFVIMGSVSETPCLKPLSNVVGFHHRAAGELQEDCPRETDVLDNKYSTLNARYFSGPTLGAAVIFPKITNLKITGPPKNLSKSETFAGLARNSLILQQCPSNEKPLVMNHLVALANNLRGYRVDLGTDLLEDPSGFTRLISRIPS